MKTHEMIERLRGCDDIALAQLLRRHFGNARSGGFLERDMPEVRAIEDEIDRRNEQPAEVLTVGASVAAALTAAKAVVATSQQDGRCRSIIITKLEEAQHRVAELSG
jgi:hypothetical protein